MTVGVCRSCGAEIVWVLTEKGHRMPIDPEPCPKNGNLEIDDDGIASALRDDDIVRARFEGKALYLSHFATCPNAARHRRTRRTAA